MCPASCHASASPFIQPHLHPSSHFLARRTSCLQQERCRAARPTHTPALSPLQGQISTQCMASARTGSFGLRITTGAAGVVASATAMSISSVHGDGGAGGNGAGPPRPDPGGMAP
eukprot:351375-Chlamydomonas_euryale.AAC.15